jgi:hypothetical protein
MIDSMATPANPRYVVGQVLALLGLGGGNARALANVRGAIDVRQQALTRVDALQARMRVAPDG